MRDGRVHWGRAPNVRFGRARLAAKNCGEYAVILTKAAQVGDFLI